MALKLPALDKAAPIVETTFGRITPYFQRFWQNVTSEVARAIDAVETAIPEEIALKAPLASPVFTGDPQAPTPAPGDNDVSIATTAFATAADAVQRAQVDAALALKAALDSPALTGVPTAPTATAGTSTTQVATTAFATGAVVDLYNALTIGAPPTLDTFAEVADALALKATPAYADAAAATASAGKSDKAAFAGLGAPTGVADGSAFDIATATLPQLAAYVAAMRNAGAA
jgi:DNA-binding phage protein